MSTGRFGGPHVSAGRSLHTDETTGHGAERAADKSKSSLIAHADQNQHKNNSNKNRQHPVFTIQKRHRTGMNIVSDLMHSLVTDRLVLDDFVKHNRDCESDYPQDGSPHLHTHLFSASLLKMFKVNPTSYSY